MQAGQRMSTTSVLVACFRQHRAGDTLLETPFFFHGPREVSGRRNPQGGRVGWNVIREILSSRCVNSQLA